MRSAGPGDDQARFLADLRALRDMAAIGYDELAARAHYPCDVLKEAENGPLLPGLPILTAYVRACEGNVPDWEERWRQLTSEIPEDPDLPVRPPGASPAAVAGARAGVGIAAPDVYDPERIKAALRGGALSRPGGSGTTRNGSHEAASRSKVASGWSATPGWHSSDDTVATTNGNLAGTSWSREPFDAAAKPDPAPSAEPADQFRWLPGEDSAGPDGDGGPADPAPADAGDAAAWAPDPASGAVQADAEPGVSEWTPRWDEAAKPAEGTDFWSSSAAPAADRPPSAVASPPLDEPVYPDTSWSAPAWTPPPSSSRPSPSAPAAPAPADPEAPASAGAVAGAGSAPAAGSSGAADTASPAGSGVSAGSGVLAGSGASGVSAAPGDSLTAQATTRAAAIHQKDRFFPARLLVIIVVAALVGSVLVLLLK